MLPADPIIGVEDILKMCGEPDFTLTATSSSTGGYTFTALTGGIVDITGSNVSILEGGTTIVEVSQAADTNYNQATTTFTITVLPGNPIIEAEDITVTYGDADFTLTATSSSSAFFAYTIADTDVATISGTTVTIKGCLLYTSPSPRD